MDLFDQHKMIQGNKLFIETINNLSLYIIIVNQEQSVVYINQQMREDFNQDLYYSLGQRLGDLLKCKNAYEQKRGCQKNSYCHECPGKLLLEKSILTHQKNRGTVEFISVLNNIERKMTYEENIIPIFVSGVAFYMITLKDRTAEMDKEVLKHIFYHDVFNVINRIKNGIQLKLLDESDDELLRLVDDQICNLTDMIYFQKSIERVEAGIEDIEMETFEIYQPIQKMVTLLEDEFQVVIALSGDKVKLKSNKMIFLRIVGNLIKNACEACKTQVQVRVTDQHVAVENPGRIDHEVSRHIFTKGFSTKGKGRGLGLYGSKLLAERLLKMKLIYIEEPTIFMLKYKD